MDVVVASGNLSHKVAELRAMLLAAVPGVTVRSMKAYGDPPEIEETAETFEGNATLKATGIASWLREHKAPGDTYVLADDSGICIDAFGGAPGVYSARYAGEPSDDAANNRKVVAELSARSLAESAAHYACVLALVRVDGRGIASKAVQTFEGRFDVNVRAVARGTGGFGYDPHAWLAGQDKTVAELSEEHKARISHRGEATRALVAFLAGLQ